MRAYLLIISIATCSCTSDTPPENRALISAVEERAVMPKGAGDLKCYKGYYTVVRGKQLQEIFGGKEVPFSEMLVGIIRPPDSTNKPGIEWVDNIDEVGKIGDGGCEDMRIYHPIGPPEQKINVTCSFTFSGDIPEAVHGDPITC